MNSYQTDQEPTSMDISEKDGIQKGMPRTGTKLMKRVGTTMKKTQTNVKNAAKFTQANIVNTAKQTQANIRNASSTATAVMERTTGVHLPRKRTKMEDNSANEQMNTEESQNRTVVSKQTEFNQTVEKELSCAVPHDIYRDNKQVDIPQKSRKGSLDAPKTLFPQELQQPAQFIRNPSIIAVVLASLISTFKSIANYSSIWDNQVAVHVAATWVALALVLGIEIGRRQAAKEFREFLTIQSSIAEKQSSISSATQDLSRQMPEKHDPLDSSQQTQNLTRMQKVLNRVQFRVSQTTAPWTTLGKDPKRQRQRWERSGNVLVSKLLTRALKEKTPSNRRKSLARIGISQQEIQAATEEDESLFMGSIDDPERLRAKSLEEVAIEPLCRLRGMDIFLTDSPESDLAEHSFLIENGLRDRPTFIINMLTQWGNVAIYFELPDWITSWDEFVEKDNDPEDVIALKRFLNGDDEYRNLRWKCLPVLIDGPATIKYMAPKSRNTAKIATPTLPTCWKKHAPTFDNSGKMALHPCLEVECDLMANRAKRSMAALIKRYLVSIVADVGVLIEKPDLQDEDEPRACLGMCRFDRIDVSFCPTMPPRKIEADTEEEQELMRASFVLRQSQAGLSDLSKRTV